MFSKPFSYTLPLPSPSPHHKSPPHYRLFPHVNVMTELHYRYNMRFLQPDNYIMSGGVTGCASQPLTLSPTSMSPPQVQRGDHLTYLFQPQFAAGRAFCASMLDTMLYQSHSKPYIIELMEQLLGCQQVKDSAYLWKVNYVTMETIRGRNLTVCTCPCSLQLEVGEELLKMQTYDRLFQRVVTVYHCVPLGLYRTVPLSSCSVFQVSTGVRRRERLTVFRPSPSNSLSLAPSLPPPFFCRNISPSEWPMTLTGSWGTCNLV